MLSYWRRSRSTSPKRSYSTHGTTTAASPHAAAGCTGKSRSTQGTYDGHRAELLLLVGEVLQPGREEAAAVVQERRGRCEHLDVAGPAEALVALRAIGRQVDEVPAHAPAHVLVEPVEPVVRRVERAGRLHVGVAHDGLDRVGRQLARPAVDLHVAEAVDRERRLVGLDAATAEHVGVGLRRAAERPGAELAVLEHLGVVQHDRVTGRAVDGEPDPAGDVLAEVDDGGAAGRCADRHRPHRLDPAHGWSGGRRHQMGDRRELAGVDPVAVVEARCRPFGLGQPGVVRLAVVQAGREVGPETGAPVTIRGDRVDRAVVVAELQLGDRPGVGAVDLAAPSAEAEAAPVPPLGDGDARGRSRPRGWRP